MQGRHGEQGCARKARGEGGGRAHGSGRQGLPALAGRLLRRHLQRRQGRAGDTGRIGQRGRQHRGDQARVGQRPQHRLRAPQDAPQWQRDSARRAVQMHTENPDAGPQASHESWMAQKVAEGWKYGPEKRPDLKEHHGMVPFDALPSEQQAKDYIFRGGVHALAHAPATVAA